VLRIITPNKISVEESEVEKKFHSPDPEEVLVSKEEGTPHSQPVPSRRFQPRGQTLSAGACPQSIGYFSDPTVVNLTLSLSSG